MKSYRACLVVLFKGQRCINSRINRRMPEYAGTCKKSKKIKLLWEVCIWNLKYWKIWNPSDSKYLSFRNFLLLFLFLHFGVKYSIRTTWTKIYKRILIFSVKEMVTWHVWPRNGRYYLPEHLSERKLETRLLSSINWIN